MMKKFKLEIRLGNAAMMTLGDVANSLSKLAIHLMKVWLHGGKGQGIIQDRNGNTVGEWSVE